jgi:ubiquinone biosynthesis protein
MKKSRERFQEIVKVFVHYGFGYMLENSNSENKKSPQNLRKAFEELGPTFIKIGQILSTRTDILPKEYVMELSKLQDSAPREDKEILEAVFKDDINKNITECFFSFNEVPIASASIAQVHEAVLLDGRSVVVKIQRPDIYEKMKMDISILKRIIKLTKQRINIKVVDPLEVLEEIEETTRNELNFINEGKNIQRFISNNIDVQAIYAPRLIEEIWSERVLVLERIQGFKINDLKKIKSEGYDNKDIANKLALSYCKQVFEDGFFHADPHPGNLLISDSKICFLDFGIMGELDEKLRNWLNTAMGAVATKDKNKLVDCILAIGIKQGRIEKGDIYEDVSYLVDTYLTTSLKNIKITVLLQEIFEITKKNNIQLPKELVILVRGLMILEGVVAEIDPEIEIIAVVISFVKSKGKYSFLKELSKEEIILQALEFTRDSVRIPSKTLEVLNKISNGKVQVKFNINNIENIVCKIDTMVNRLTGGLLIAALVVSSSMIISSNVGPSYQGISILGIIGYIISTIFATILLYNMIKTGLFSSKSKKK